MPFIRTASDAGPTVTREVVMGQWGLIPWFAKDRNLKYVTSNARTEELPNPGRL